MKNSPGLSTLKKEDDKIVYDLAAITESVVKLSQIGKKIQQSKLKQKAILILLHHITKVPQRDIKIVLDALPQLEREYLK